MSRRTSVTRLPAVCTYSAPSPSTRARASTLIVRRLTGMGVTGAAVRRARRDAQRLGRPAERLLLAVDPAVGPRDRRVRHAEMPPPGGERIRVGTLHRAVAAVASAVVSGADRAASRVGDGAEARRPAGHHDADRAAPLALDADAVVPDDGRPPVEIGAQDLEELRLLIGQPWSSKSTFTCAEIGV